MFRVPERDLIFQGKQTRETCSSFEKQELDDTVQHGNWFLFLSVQLAPIPQYPQIVPAMSLSQWSA